MRIRLSLTDIERVLVAVADADGFDAVTVTRIATELSVRPSALYTHVDGLAGLRTLLAGNASETLADRLRTAAIGQAGPDALTALAQEYRTFAQEHPGQFGATLAVRTTEHAAASPVLDVFALVYRAMGLDDLESRRAATHTRSAVHGFCALEHTAGPAHGQDDDFARLLTMVLGGHIDGAA